MPHIASFVEWCETAVHRNEPPPQMFQTRHRKPNPAHLDTHRIQTRRSLVPENEYSLHVYVVVWHEKSTQAGDDGLEHPVYLAAFRLTNLWDDKEEVIGLRADVALPQIQQIHVVGKGLSSFYLHQDSGGPDRAEVVRS